MIIQQYRLIEDSDPQGLTNQVNDYLESGWKLYGSPAVAACKLGVSFTQAVVKESEQPDAHS